MGPAIKLISTSNGEISFIEKKTKKLYFGILNSNEPILFVLDHTPINLDVHSLQK